MADKQNRCWPGYEPVPGKKPHSQGSCKPKAESKSSPSEKDFRAKRRKQLDEKQAEHPGRRPQSLQHLGPPARTKKDATKDKAASGNKSQKASDTKRSSTKEARAATKKPVARKAVAKKAATKKSHSRKTSAKKDQSVVSTHSSNGPDTRELWCPAIVIKFYLCVSFRFALTAEFTAQRKQSA